MITKSVHYQWTIILVDVSPSQKFMAIQWLKVAKHLREVPISPLNTSYQMTFTVHGQINLKHATATKNDHTQ